MTAGGSATHSGGIVAAGLALMIVTSRSRSAPSEPGSGSLGLVGPGPARGTTQSGGSDQLQKHEQPECVALPADGGRSTQLPPPPRPESWPARHYPGPLAGTFPRQPPLWLSAVARLNALVEPFDQGPEIAPLLLRQSSSLYEVTQERCERPTAQRLGHRLELAADQLVAVGRRPKQVDALAPVAEHVPFDSSRSSSFCTVA